MSGTTCLQKIEYNNTSERFIPISRGDILEVDLSQMIKDNNNYSFQQGNRPVIVLQNDIGNKFSPTISIATFTSKLNKNKLPTHVTVSAENSGLRQNSLILIEQVYTIDKKLVIRKIGRCPDYLMEQIDMAIQIQFGTIRQQDISYKVDWIKKVEARAIVDCFDPEDARLHEMLLNEIHAYCNQYGYDINKLLGEKQFVKESYKQVI